MLLYKAHQKFGIHFIFTVEPQFNRPLNNEVLGITKDIFQPSNSIMYGEEPQYNEPLINKQFPQSFGTLLNRGSTVL